MELETVLKVLRALEKMKVEYCIVGGVALNFHGLPRATMDIDLFISPREENVQSLKDALMSVFNDPDIARISSTDLAGDYPAVQYVPPDGTFHIDILARLGQAFSFDDIEKETIEIEGIRVPIATARMLYRMKKDTVRMQDKADAERLRQRFGFKEE